MIKDTEKAFLWIVNILEKHNIVYKISGGFAARLYGVDRELADIDIEVEDHSINLIAQHIPSEYIIYGPMLYKDENWELNLLTLLYEGQEIDIASVESKIFNQVSQQWESLEDTLDYVKFMDVFGKKVPVETIEKLIAYKSKLFRDVDQEDIRQLKLLAK